MKKILTWFSLLFLVLWSSRCTKDDGGDYFAGARAPAKLDRTEARMFFESNATDLRHVDFRMSDHERHESGGSTKTHSVTCLDEQVITPLWDEFRVYDDGGAFADGREAHTLFRNYAKGYFRIERCIEYGHSFGGKCGRQ